MTFNGCSSKWMSKTRAIGFGVASKVEFEPTSDARSHARDALTDLDVALASTSENYIVYRQMWEDLKRCQAFPDGLTGPQRHSMYAQMACHARYGIASVIGGNTWAFEAWLPDVDWSRALDVPSHRCQWPGLDSGGPTISGFVAAAQGQHVRSSLEEDDHFETWIIADRKRRRVTSTEVYNCLVAAGKEARLYPGEFLNDYFNLPGLHDVTAAEACGTHAPPRAAKLTITGSCTTNGGTLGSTSSGFTPGGTATIQAWYPDGREYTNLASESSVRSDGSIAWSWPCQGDPSGTYTTMAVDDATGTSTGRVAFTIGASQAPERVRVNAYDNYGSGAIGRAMCRGNPNRPESMPGGTATQTLTVPAGVASIDTAVVQIDPDPQVTAHAALSVNGTQRATAQAAAAGDTTFGFGAVAVSAGDQVALSFSFSATFGKIITVYTVGSPGGTFTASNSCSDGAPNVSTTSTGLRAVLSGWNS
jgi:hypothetical protein